MRLNVKQDNLLLNFKSVKPNLVTEIADKREFYFQRVDEILRKLFILQIFRDSTKLKFTT